MDGQERFELKQGHITTCRFDDAEGRYYLFAGEGDTTRGPETNGTYTYLEVDDWKRWEEKLMFGPYIHPVSYTHLEVYKRQEYIAGRLELSKITL